MEIINDHLWYAQVNKIIEGWLDCSPEELENKILTLENILRETPEDEIYRQWFYVDKAGKEHWHRYTKHSVLETNLCSIESIRKCVRISFDRGDYKPLSGSITEHWKRAKPIYRPSTLNNACYRRVIYGF